MLVNSLFQEEMFAALSPIGVKKTSAYGTLKPITPVSFLLMLQVGQGFCIIVTPSFLPISVFLGFSPRILESLPTYFPLLSFKLVLAFLLFWESSSLMKLGTVLSRVHLSGRMSLAEMGRRLGGVSVSAISQNKKRLEAALQKDPHLRKRFQGLSEGLGSKSSQ